MHSLNATYACLIPIVQKFVSGGQASPGLRCSKKNHGRAHITKRESDEFNETGRSSMHAHQTPPEKAINTLNALVLFSTLSSDFKPLRIPTMIARMTISPAEQMAKDMFEIRLRESEAKRLWSCKLSVEHEYQEYLFEASRVLTKSVPPSCRTTTS
jgi:hypothetical protein